MDRFTQTGVLSMLFQFEHMHLDKRPDDPLQAQHPTLEAV
jgi:hypothetical protein